MVCLFFGFLSVHVCNVTVMYHTESRFRSFEGEHINLSRFISDNWCCRSARFKGNTEKLPWKDTHFSAGLVPKNVVLWSQEFMVLSYKCRDNAVSKLDRSLSKFSPYNNTQYYSSFHSLSA